MTEGPRFRPAANPRRIVIGPETPYTKTLREIRADEHRYAAYVLFKYRAAELDLPQIPSSHYNNPSDPRILPLTQHSEYRGIQSCVNTTQLNAMLWQGQISQAAAERVNQSLAGELRPYFGEPYRSEFSGQVMQVGNLAMAQHFNTIVPEEDFSYLEAEYGERDMAQVILTELSRGSVVTVNTIEHVMLAVGYADLNLGDPLRTVLYLCDPLEPQRIKPLPINRFRKTSMITPSLKDPVRNFVKDLS